MFKFRSLYDLKPGVNWKPIRAIYFFFINKEIVYIGKTKDFHDRLKSHFNNSFYNSEKIKIKEVTEIIAKDCKDYSMEIVTIVEKKLIQKYKPKWNITHNSNNKRKPSLWNI